MKKKEEKIYWSHYNVQVHAYRPVFKKKILWFLYAASNKKKSECTANKASSI